MTPEQREKLQQLKALQQQKLLFQEFMDREILSFEEEAGGLSQFESFKIVTLTGIPYEIKSEVHTAMSQVRFLGKDFKYNGALTDAIEGEINRLVNKYKTDNPFYFAPSLPKVQIPQVYMNAGLSFCVRELNLADELVCVCFMGQSPVFKIRLKDLAAADERGLFNLYQDCVFLFPASQGYFLVQDIEGNWYFGKDSITVCNF